ncbi:MAG: hypothetical protein ACRDF4_11410 [Rhabdochlamydiaceae bacterium]
MLKCSSRIAWARKDQGQTITQLLSENNQCYVLITCGEPTQDGQMEVEMTYGGDPVLAAYLVESASTIMDDAL